MSGSIPYLASWIAAEERVAARSLLSAISATGIVKHRKGFGQIIVPMRGSVLASPIPASYDPDPDYFFHWLRDSAIAIDALRHLSTDPELGPRARQAFRDFVGFSLSLTRLDGRALLRAGDIRAKVKPDFLKYARPDDALAEVHGERILSETRFNPDGTLDIIDWPRPQNDGPAMRALALMRWWPLEPDEQVRTAIGELLRGDLSFTASRWAEPCFDIWEEEIGLHFYVGLVQLAALEAGARWARETADNTRAGRYADSASALAARLPQHVSRDGGFYLSRIAARGSTVSADKELDAATILAVIHAGRKDARFGVSDPLAQRTLARLAQLFAEEYAINHSRPPGWAPAIGRYTGDTYYSGGAYVMTTLAFAEFHFRLAAALGNGSALGNTSAPLDPEFTSTLPPDGGDRARALVARGDAYLDTLRTFTPRSGELAEQFDRTTGAPASAKKLTWSYAAFLTAAEARKAAVAAVSGAA